MGDTDKFEDFYGNAEHRIQKLNKRRDDALREDPHTGTAQLSEMLGRISSADEIAPGRYKTICQHCGAPHDPLKAKCDYCDGYVEADTCQIEKKRADKPYSVKYWDGEKWVSKVVNPM